MGATPRYKSGFPHEPKRNHPVDTVVAVHYPRRNSISLLHSIREHPLLPPPGVDLTRY